MINYDKKWTLKHYSDLKEDEFCKELNISKAISQVIRNRGIINLDDIKTFINPSLEYLHDPFLLKDMDKAVNRIKKAIKNNENIWIYGDYDVDGVSSTSILLIYFKSIGYEVNYYIPNRLEEGYGLNIEAIDYIKEKDANLIITVDCGITSVDEVNYINSLGIDVIITDHHECKEEIPSALAVVNPKREDCNYPFEVLCGCGVALKLIQALTPKDEFEYSIYNYLEIVTLATICDIVPLIGENRILVKNGLKVMENSRNIGIKSLIKVCGLDEKKINSSHIGFGLGPRINASGRMGYSDLGVKLFTEEDEDKAFEIAKVLEEKNIERQLIESKIYKEAEDMILSDERYKNEKVLVLASPKWHHGIIGIVASKITEKYYKPTILLAIEDGEAKGSARSIEGFNIFEALLLNEDILNKFGGHEQAAGLSLDENKIPILREKINSCADFKLSSEDMIENIKVEFELPQEDIDFNLINELDNLEPFGMNNPSPKFLIRNLEIIDIRTVGREREHLKLTLRGKTNYDCIGFNMGHFINKFISGDKVDVVFALDENEYKGNKKIQFILKDTRLFYPKNITKNNNFIKLFKYINPINLDYYKNENINIIPKKEINSLEYIKDNTLILVNSIQNLAKAVSDISLLDIDYNINFNYEMEKDKSTQIILFPHIDKINFKRYNSIVLYDFLYTLDDYSFIYKNVDENTKIIKNYKKEDINNLDYIVNNLIPSRQELVNIYKILKTHKHLDITFEDIEFIFGLNIIKVLNGLKIFKDVNLLDFKMEDKINITLLPQPKEKVDLNTSLTLNNLNKFKSKYLKIKEIIAFREE
ncbi:single-stranded-DNA-specific exonuclease RecJ [Tepidibacter formicigenes]|jgi:single-stranded-DNA-specific exonuclease|uniref:Single-stranded-DNA-specific exonuclease RecJ n=1 Tax=Tepidibacter formicigenes DSM 15518 TaxID=1123349 RepID=A0A1M6MVV9_9FIRM|nr:single-stranded-DNA-specific exonuclease RecJ [Tepidibacter formicigenes]SHJ87529.1 single-stranded-DNA-specific exonuclease [Tepidibacter formicigenes DSM 15518]